MKKEQLELELQRMEEINSSVEKFFSELINNQKLSNEMLKKIIVFLYVFGDSLKKLREEAARKIFEQNPNYDDLTYVWMYTSLKVEARQKYEEILSEKI
jgi:hypothetical protein